MLSRPQHKTTSITIAFEKGRSWPRRGTLAKLEEVLNWPPGTISRIRYGAPVAQGSETTEVLTDTVQAPLLAQAVDAECERPASPDAAAAIETLIAQLATS